MVAEAVVDAAALFEAGPVEEHLDVAVGRADLVVDAQLVPGKVDGEVGAEELLDVQIVPGHVHGGVGISVEGHGTGHRHHVVQEGLANDGLHHGVSGAQPVPADLARGVVRPIDVGVVVLVGRAVDEARGGAGGEADVEQHARQVGVLPDAVDDLLEGEEVLRVGAHLVDEALPGLLVGFLFGHGQFVRQGAEAAGHLDELADGEHGHEELVELVGEPLGRLDADVVGRVQHGGLVRRGHLAGGEEAGRGQDGEEEEGRQDDAGVGPEGAERAGERGLLLVAQEAQRLPARGAFGVGLLGGVGGVVPRIVLVGDGLGVGPRVLLGPGLLGDLGPDVGPAVQAEGTVRAAGAAAGAAVGRRQRRPRHVGAHTEAALPGVRVVDRLHGLDGGGVEGDRGGLRLLPGPGLGLGLGLGGLFGFGFGLDFRSRSRRSLRRLAALPPALQLQVDEGRAGAALVVRGLGGGHAVEGMTLARHFTNRSWFCAD